MSNEFVTAAFRFGHTIVNNQYPRFNRNNTIIDNILSISDINFKSDEAYKQEFFKFWYLQHKIILT